MKSITQTMTMKKIMMMIVMTTINMRMMSRMKTMIFGKKQEINVWSHVSKFEHCLLMRFAHLN